MSGRAGHAHHSRLLPLVRHTHTTTSKRAMRNQVRTPAARCICAPRSLCDCLLALFDVQVSVREVRQASGGAREGGGQGPAMPQMQSRHQDHSQDVLKQGGTTRPPRPAAPRRWTSHDCLYHPWLTRPLSPFLAASRPPAPVRSILLKSNHSRMISSNVARIRFVRSRALC